MYVLVGEVFIYANIVILVLDQCWYSINNLDVVCLSCKRHGDV